MQTDETDLRTLPAQERSRAHVTARERGRVALVRDIIRASEFAGGDPDWWPRQLEHYGDIIDGIIVAELVQLAEAIEIQARAVTLMPSDSVAKGARLQGIATGYRKSASMARDLAARLASEDDQ